MSAEAAAWPGGPGWRFLLASKSVLLLRIGPDGLIRAANRYAFELLGETLVGQPWHALLLEFGGQVVLADWLSGGPSVRLLNFRTVAGLPQTFEASLELLGSDYLLLGEVNAADQALLSREVLELNHELNNISRELALKNDDLIKTQGQLLQSEKMAAIGQLAAGMAHEINNPVGFMKSNLGVLQEYAADIRAVLAAYQSLEAELGAESRARLGAVKQRVGLDFLQDDLDGLLDETLQGVQRVQEIVRDLGTFSQVSRSAESWFNLESGLDSTLALLAHDFGNEVRVLRDYAGLPEILCVPAQLNQAFLNILLNARQAIHGAGQITVLTRRTTDDLRVEIEDSGRGIAPEHLGRIFEPFFTTQPVGKGRGLGLSLAYGVVKSHRGRIEVASEPGKGARLTVILPLPGEPGATVG